MRRTLSEAALDQAPFSWLVIYAKPQGEVVARDALTRRGYEVFLPLCQQRSRRSDVQPLPVRPLFPRYLFVRLSSLEPRYPLRFIPGVTTVLTFGDTGSATVPESVIGEIRARMAADGGVVLLDPVEERFRQGQRCRVLDGPLEGRTGLYVDLVGTRIRLILGLLGRGVTVAVPDAAVVAA